MKFDLTQLDPITREFVQSNPGGSAIQVSSRGQRLYYLAVVLLLLFLLKFRWDYFVFFVTGYLMIWYAAAVFFRGGAAVLGIHLEGPFLSPQYKGAMPESLLRKGDAGWVRRCQQQAGGRIRYITVAPEVEGVPELIRALHDEIPIAIGHSGADYATARQAIADGARACTHTFNGMRLFHQHEPAIMGAVLASPDVYCEAICDGRHLHPGTVEMLLRCKGLDRVVAITDSIQAAGLPDGNYKLGVNDVVVVDGDAKLASNGVRAGSTLSQDTALRNIMAFTGHGAEDVLPLLSENPARLLGIFDHKGSIDPGKDADLVVLDDGWQVCRTIVGGVTVYQAE